jgi:hypothetical protein
MDMSELGQIYAMMSLTVPTNGVPANDYYRDMKAFERQLDFFAPQEEYLKDKMKYLQ